ncbi:MAG: aldo/keto reductase [Clostridia bacterium]|nr:aldo/keto reductase [Clostridia bacterium]
MIYSQLNNTNLSISKLVLGSHLFGTEIDEKTSFALLDRFFEAGGNIVDTASVYANWLSSEKHKSEKTLGKWLDSCGHRKEMIVVTKGGHHDLETNKSRLFYKDVREDLEKSFENLRTDYIDIYYLHKDDEKQQPEDLIQMLNDAVKGYDVRYLGVSNWSFDRIKRANDYAASKQLKPIIASQIQYSIAKVNIAPDDIFVMNDNEYAKYCQSDLNVFGFSAQAKGLFAILEDKGAENLPDLHKTEFLNAYNLKLFERLKELANKKNTTVSTLVLAALINDSKLNTFAQIGPVTQEQLETSLKATTVSLTDSEREFLFDIY